MPIYGDVTGAPTDNVEMSLGPQLSDHVMPIYGDVTWITTNLPCDAHIWRCHWYPIELIL
ncbi:hypothetical protein DPMN_005428 [Dreissena polymorpha]|uniref:Uncharacterized protein n=1 Tax=Dreissena polymorpha TaxID=45954 RepID=A0A9D4MUK8_DREPO|nr:hypothetical protein DPMN_005428 [Dreissena polymorpha]